MDWFKINEEGDIEFIISEVKLVPEVQAILAPNYNKGKGDFEGRKKSRAKNELRYLVLAYSRKSPYVDYTEKERIAQARVDCGLTEDWVESQELKELIPKFIEGNKNRATRLLGTVVRFLDKFETHLNDINLDERAMSGSLVHSPKLIMDTLKQLPGMTETLTELERQARTDIVKKVGSKGDHELGWMSNATKQTKQKTVEEDDTDIQPQGEDS